MIEQEKREKAIEEMKSVAEKYCEVIDNVYGCDRECIPCTLLFGELYDTGYRKKKEVRKEAVKDFLDKIMERAVHLDTAYGELHFVVETVDILEIAKDFDVE